MESISFEEINYTEKYLFSIRGTFWGSFFPHCALTAKTRQLVVDGRICCCSQFMIFLLEVLGPAKQPMAGPSSSNRKIKD